MTVDIGGTASDNIGVTQVAWSNDRGGSGVCTGTTTWSKAGIPLQSGQNIITVTARDAAGNKTDDTLTVTCTPADIVAPTVTITTPSPGLGYTYSPIRVVGVATDAGSPTTGVASVEVRVNGGTWQAVSGSTNVWECYVPPHHPDEIPSTPGPRIMPVTLQLLSRW